MSLTSFIRPGRKRSGCIKSVSLVSANDIASVTYNTFLDSFSGIPFTDDAKFCAYDFEEDSAYLKETVLTANGSTSVRHELSFSLPLLEFESMKAFSGIIENNDSGLIAVIVTANG